MIRILKFAAACALAVCVPISVAAQQVGESINVLPVYTGGTDLCASGLPCDALRGDLFGQRQDEPSLGVSTLNKDHIVVVYNDWRAVDVPTDPMIPGTASTLARLWDGVRGLLARLAGAPAPRTPEPSRKAASEAGLGMSVSYDGGLTWTGGFVPGLPFDASPASLASPAHKAGLQGMSDPVIVSAPCGRFYLAYLAFTREGISQMLVSRLQDLNNSDVTHTVQWQGTTLVEQGSNAAYGHFLDKPHMALALTGASSCTAVTERVYVSYTTFTGNSKTGKFQSKINLATSIDGGRTFTVAKVDDSYTQSQGTAVVVNPVTNDVYVFWRSFNVPDSMIMSKTTRTGWSKPIDLLASDPSRTLATFDQPSVTTQDPLGNAVKAELAFRSNAFPTAAITPDGSTLLVAWQERVSASGMPDPAGSPRIVWKSSRDGGATWTQRMAVTNNHPASPGGLGFFDAGTTVGPQVMPSLACGPGNRCLLTYYEARPYEQSDAAGLSPVYHWIGGYDRALDLRAAVIDAQGGELKTFPSFQVSRYSYRPLDKGELPGENDSYMAQICTNSSHCYAGKNYGGYPHTGSGTTPFMGDYNDVQPVVRYVKDSDASAWRIASKAADAPYDSGFVAVWADNRNVVRPQPADGTEWKNFGNYGPAGKGGSCLNPGSRDQSVMAAQVSLGLLVTAPANYKPFVAPRIEFPMTVWNNTAHDRQFQLDLSGSGPSSLSKDDQTLAQGFLTIYAYSSSSVNVYAWNGSAVTVKVTECTLAGCAPMSGALTGSITFNAPSAVPPSGAAWAYEPATIAVNPVPKNPVPKNPVPKNPVPKNPVPSDRTVYDVIDYSWIVTPSNQDDTGTYLALANVDKAYQNDYVFQIFVTKPATAYAVDGCEPTNLTMGTLVANISDPSNPVPKNPVPKNPVPKNPVPKNAPPADALVQNSTFTLGSSTAVSGTSSTSSGPYAASDCNATTGVGLIGDCTMAAPRTPNEVTITVRAYQVTANPTAIYDPYGEHGTPNPPSAIVAEYWCTGSEGGCAFVEDGPDLVAPESATVAPTTVKAGGTVTFPTAAQNVPNAGNRPALAHEVGYYISAAATVSDLPRTANGTINTTSATVYSRLLASVSMPVLNEGSAETVAATVLTIPTDVPRPNADGTGTYYLYAYVDSTRVVSELDEENNIIQGGPITVLAPGYGITGLQTPCSGMTCDKTGTMPLAWQFTRGSVAADSVANLPRLNFWGGCPNLNRDSEGYPTDAPLKMSEPDPSDLTSGKSGWQYFPNAGMTRPQYTWQFNFDATGLPRGTCYTMWIEIPSTQQVVPPTDPALKPFGPFSITPR